MPPSHPDRYRPDIDGLRAIRRDAGGEFPRLLRTPSRAGFVGVDVFFVISGFLITGIIARELDSQRFQPARIFMTGGCARIFPGSCRRARRRARAGLAVDAAGGLRKN